MPLKLQVDGLPELKRAIRAMAEAGRTVEAKRLYLQAGAVLRDAARQLAPYNPRRKRGTHLRDAIFVGGGPLSKPDVLVGVNRRKAPHAWIVEFGRRGWVGKPYWRPAISSTKRTILDMISRGLCALFESHFQRR